MRTTKSSAIDLRLVYAVGIPTLIAIAALFGSTLWIIGYYFYSIYLTEKPAPELVQKPDPTRPQLELRHRELLKKAGFRNDANLKSVPTATLKQRNFELETALRSGTINQ